MAIIKHEIPLLEYDDNPLAMIMPDHKHYDMRLPSKTVFAFLGDAIDRYAEAHGGRVVGEFISATKNYPIYVIEHHGEEICLCRAPVGAAAAVQVLDWLIGYGAKEILSAGSCGALRDLPENTFLIPTRAMRDEGTSYHYLPPARYIALDQNMAELIAKGLQAKALPSLFCTTWTTDGFFRETAEKVAYRRDEGCDVVDMECAALAACAAFRGVKFGQLLYTADTLANTACYDERDWGAGSVETALLLCLDILTKKQ